MWWLIGAGIAVCMIALVWAMCADAGNADDLAGIPRG